MMRLSKRKIFLSLIFIFVVLGTNPQTVLAELTPEEYAAKLAECKKAEGENAYLKKNPATPAIPEYFCIGEDGLDGVVGNSGTPNDSNIVAAGLEMAFGPILGSIGVAVSGLMAIILGLAGVLFNLAIEDSVLNMSGYIKKISDTITIGWTLFRDLINMGLIFVLLYASIKTILGAGGFNIKDTIKNVIIVALFINFSLLATKVVVDTSNVLASGMYQNIVTSTKDAGTSSEEVSVDDSRFLARNFGLSGAIMRPILLTGTFNPKTEASGGLGTALFGLTSTSFDPFRVFTVSMVGSVMMLVTAFVFFAGAIMFYIRLAMIVILMVVSPLAFGSMAFPGMNKYAGEWWGKLLHYSFFAPAYLFLIYFVAYFLNNAAVKSDDQYGIIINFVIAIIMMLATLVLANTLGIAGSKIAREWAGKFSFGAAGWVGRQTVGRGGRYLSNNDWLLDQSSKGGVRGYLAKRTLLVADNTSKRSFDFRQSNLGKIASSKAGGFGDVPKEASGGYEGVREAYIKDKTSFAELISKRGKASDIVKQQRRLDNATSLEKRTLWSTLTGRTEPNTAAAKSINKDAKLALAKAQIEETNRTRSKDVNDLVAAGAAPAAIAAAVAALPIRAARMLNHDSRMNHDVINALTVGHLADLRSNSDPELTQAEVDEIRTVTLLGAAAAPGTPARQKADWMNDPRRIADWT